MHKCGSWPSKIPRILEDSCALHTRLFEAGLQRWKDRADKRMYATSFAAGICRHPLILRAVSSAPRPQICCEQRESHDAVLISGGQSSRTSTADENREWMVIERKYAISYCCPLNDWPIFRSQGPPKSYTNHCTRWSDCGCAVENVAMRPDVSLCINVHIP